MDENSGFKYMEKTKVTNELINETTGEQKDKSKNWLTHTKTIGYREPLE